MALIIPVTGQFTDPFDPGRGYVPGVGYMGAHTGQDIAAPTGTPIYAAHDGVISQAWWDAENGVPMGGWMVEIHGDDGLSTRYAHMNTPSPLPVGTRVIQGTTVIGYVGSSGAANGPHLHFEVLDGGVRVDPLPYIGSVREEDDMTPEQSMQLKSVYGAIFGPRNIGGWELSWETIDGVRTAQYGVLDIDIHTQSLVAQLIGQVAALSAAIQALPGGGNIDMARLEAAAERGARESVSGLTLKADVG